jgi:nitroreductase
MVPPGDLLDEITSARRSVRKYKAEVPPAFCIEAMIACAAKAPSPSNSQPVRFVRISSPEIRASLHEEMIRRQRDLLDRVEAEHSPKRTRNLVNACFRYSEFMFYAPVLIAAGTIPGSGGFSRRLAEAKLLPEDSRDRTDLDISLGMALKGFLLKGLALGLGTCVLTAPLLFLADVEKTLGLEDVCIKCFVTVGFPGETPSFVERKSVDDIYREV